MPNWTLKSAFTGLNGKQIVDALADNHEILRAQADMQGKGLIILNGDCRIDQPNGGVSVAIGAANYCRDGLIGGKVGAGGFSWQRQTNNNLLTARNPNAFCDRYTVTTAAASPGAGDFYSAGMRVEGHRSRALQWGLSSARKAWLCATARSSIEWTLSGALQSSTADRSFMWSYPLLANTTHDIAIEIPGCIDGTWNADNTVGITVRVCLGVGSTFSGSAGSWQSANRIGVPGAGLMATNGATLDITSWELVIGDVAPAFYIPPDPASEFLRCQREYEAGYMAFGAIATAGNQDVFLRKEFVVPKRGSPTLSRTSTSFANCADQAISTVAQGFMQTIRSTAAGQFSASYNYTADARL